MICEVFRGVFFNRSPIPPVMSASDNEFLCMVLIDEEVKTTMFSMGSSKAPGPDSFSPIFFKHYREITGKDIVGVFQSFSRGNIC